MVGIVLRRAAGHYMRERLPRARHALPIRLQLCALHLDFDDAHRLHGCPLIYALHLEEGVELPQGQEARPMPHSDLIVFARRRRALRARADRLPAPCVRGACLARMLKTCRASCSWKAAGTHGKQAQHTHGLASRTATLPALPVVTPLTLTPQVIFCSDEHLHGNVFPDSLEPSVTPGLALLRLVPYARKGRQRSYSESCQRVCFYTGTCCEQASTPFHGQSSTTALSGSRPSRY